MSEPLTVRKSIEKLLDGTVRIPGFQRPFVWEPSRAALLMDSLYKGYPIGSLLLWRTKSRLKTERELGVFELPPPDEDYPVDYVLDGQQRLTSIFSTFQTTLEPDTSDADVWLPLYYDFSAQEDAQDSQFVALNDSDFDPEVHFPLSVFLDPVAFSKAASSLSEDRHEEIVNVQQKFLEAMIPVQTFESEDRASVAIVFERVNRMGIELDIFQLLTAWTWSDEFDLQAKFTELGEEFADFGFEEVGSDPGLMLRCAAAVLKREPTPAALVELNGAEVRDAFELIADSIRLAIDFVRTNFHVQHVGLLPYSSMLIPLTAYFSVRPSDPLTDTERAVLSRWFWRSCFSHRYSGNPQRNIRRDIEHAVKLRSGDDNALDDISVYAAPDFFRDHRFNIGTVATKTFVLALAQRQPRSFLSGQPIKVDKVLAEPNRSEYHHCFPKANLKELPSSEVNALANFAIISRSENLKIRAKLPSEYRELMPDDASEILSRALVPETLFQDDYEKFLWDRAVLLAEHQERLLGLT
jgi:hypothetical protein